MMNQELEIDILRRYLLADLDEKEDVSVSQQLLSDKRSEELLLAAEDELIDEWVRGELSSAERGLFQENFLPTLSRQRRATFSAIFENQLSGRSLPAPVTKKTENQTETKPVWDFGSWLRGLREWSPSPALSYAMAGLVLVALIGGTWAVRGQLRLAGKVEELTTELARLEETSIATVWLSPGLLRGVGEVERLMIPPESSLVLVQLDIGVDDYGSYRAALNDANGDEIWTQSKLAATTTTDDKVAVHLTLPAELLPNNDYYIRLSGVSSSGELELVGRYYFRVLDD